MVGNRRDPGYCRGPELRASLFLFPTIHDSLSGGSDDVERFRPTLGTVVFRNAQSLLSVKPALPTRTLGVFLEHTVNPGRAVIEDELLRAALSGLADSLDG